MHRAQQEVFSHGRSSHEKKYTFKHPILEGYFQQLFHPVIKETCRIERHSSSYPASIFPGHERTGLAKNHLGGNKQDNSQMDVPEPGIPHPWPSLPYTKGYDQGHGEHEERTNHMQREYDRRKALPHSA